MVAWNDPALLHATADVVVIFKQAEEETARGPSQPEQLREGHNGSENIK